jgi:hypothetical protein
MGLGDRIRRFFSKRSNPALLDLESFVAERKGIEGFIEPQTATSPTTLLLVDRDGDHRRAAVRDPQDAAAFCTAHAIPVYDAPVVGYPRRMKEFDKRSRAAAGVDLDDAIADLERRLGDEPPAPT